MIAASIVLVFIVPCGKPSSLEEIYLPQLREVPSITVKQECKPRYASLRVEEEFDDKKSLECCDNRTGGHRTMRNEGLHPKQRIYCADIWVAGGGLEAPVGRKAT